MNCNYRIGDNLLSLIMYGVLLVSLAVPTEAFSHRYLAIILGIAFPLAIGANVLHRRADQRRKLLAERKVEM